MITFLRKNIGTITASIGLIILIILTYGDIGEITTEAYWHNVKENLTGIGLLTAGLTLTQWAIKQGVCEQALQSGLNKQFFEEDGKTLKETCTPARYEEHRIILKRLREKSLYLPYFLTEYNHRETFRRKNEFLLENNFTSEDALFAWKPHWYQFGAKRLIKKYRKIKHNITVDSLKWSTTEIVYDRVGRIQKLEAYRRKRAIRGLMYSAAAMFGTALLAGGLFLELESELEWWQKTIKFISYLVVMTITVIMGIVKNYEKGAFGVANELSEINSIWYMFEQWAPTEEAIKALAILRGEVSDNKITEKKDFKNEGTDLQVQSEKVQMARLISSDNILPIPGACDSVHSIDIQPSSIESL